MVEIKTLNNIKLNELLEVFNSSFSDYFIPLQLDLNQLSSKMIADKTDLALSVGCFKNEALIGFILHGFDIIDGKQVVYNGGTGVVQNQRGKGLTKKMYEYILPILKAKGIQKIVLEVITENNPAIRSYKKSGFTIKRKVACFKGEIQIHKKNEKLIINSMNQFDWFTMESFWDIQPTWQNSISAIEASKESLVGFEANIDRKCVGYLIFNPSTKRIHQIAVDKNHRNIGVGQTLVTALIENFGNSASIINVEISANSTIEFLKKIGLEPFLHQFEMEFYF